MASATDALRFPDGFLWGAATSAHQTEGQNLNSDWWVSEQAGLVPHASGDACDSWTRWPEDIQLASDLGLNAYRMSIEWARIEPRPGEFDATALAHYRDILENVRAAGLEPIVTLHHFTNPRWLSEGGGWANPAVVGVAVRTRSTSRHLGDLARWWVTISSRPCLDSSATFPGVAAAHRNDFRGYLHHAPHHRRAAAHALRSRHPRSTGPAALARSDGSVRGDPTDQVAT
jgi:beta-glucosidase